MLVGMEMDVRGMNLFAVDGDPAWLSLIPVFVHAIGGIVLGVIYFGAGWRSAVELAKGASAAKIAALTVFRFAALAGVLFLVSLEGAVPLLVTAFGVLVARFLIVRRVKRSAS